jgi:hypothetical protein
MDQKSADNVLTFTETYTSLNASHLLTLPQYKLLDNGTTFNKGTAKEYKLDIISNPNNIDTTRIYIDNTGVLHVSASQKGTLVVNVTAISFSDFYSNIADVTDINPSGDPYN